MISVEHIAKSFGNNDVLTDVSFQVNPGERVSLLGPGSSGKSTIIKMILGLIKPDNGVVRLFDDDFYETPPHEQQEILKKVGMAFQQGGLFDFMTVYDNLAFALENMTTSISEAKQLIPEVLAGVKLPGTETKFPHELSGGMQKRVGIARALITEPDIAIFDEPTAGLDPVTSSIILNMIFELGASKANRTLLVVTSNVEIAIRFAERIVVINEGKVVADGSWKKLLIEGSNWVKHFLSVRLVGLDKEYAEGLHLPEEFIKLHW